MSDGGGALTSEAGGGGGFSGSDTGVHHRSSYSVESCFCNFATVLIEYHNIMLYNMYMMIPFFFMVLLCSKK